MIASSHNDTVYVVKAEKRQPVLRADRKLHQVFRHGSMGRVGAGR